MPGRITFVPAAEHKCSGMPLQTKLDHRTPGTIWQCDECGQEWVVVSGAQYNEDYWSWRKLTTKNRNGQDI